MPARTAFLLTAVLLLAGCGVLGRRSAPPAGAEGRGAHVVFLTRPGCAAFVARTYGRGYALIEPIEVFSPVPGTLLEGAVRPGRAMLRHYGAREVDARDGGGTAVAVQILASDLGLDEARAKLDRACPG